MTTTDFKADIERGKVGEQIFREDFLDFLQINYEDVTNCQRFQVIDSDYLTKIGLYEIKANYRDNEILIFEEYTNYNTVYGPRSFGWLYKTKADLIVFISKKTRAMVLVPFTQKFKDNWKNIRQKTELELNKVSTQGSNKWQSAFRRVPFNMINGYFSLYHKIETPDLF